MVKNKSLLPLLFGAVLGGIDTSIFNVSKSKSIKIQLPDIPKETKRDWRTKKRKKLLKEKKRQRKQRRGY